MMAFFEICNKMNRLFLYASFANPMAGDNFGVSTAQLFDCR